MTDFAHRTLPDPVAYLEDAIHALREGARDPDGLHLDPELCRGLADGLGDVRDGLELFIALAERVRAAGAQPAPRRPRSERQSLASLAQPLDLDGRVVAFPALPAGTPAFEGGSAA